MVAMETAVPAMLVSNVLPMVVASASRAVLARNVVVMAAAAPVVPSMAVVPRAKPVVAVPA